MRNKRYTLAVRRLQDGDTASSVLAEFLGLFVVISLLFQNVWRYLHWEYVATPRRGGRRLWQWSFEEFIDRVTQAAWSALAVRRAVPANRLPDEHFER